MNYEPTAYDDNWEDIPESGPFPKWIGGVLVPLVVTAYAIICFVTGQGDIPGRFGSLSVSGANAVALGLASANIGMFLHCHYFWGNIYHLAAFAVLGKIVSLIRMIGGLVFLLIHVGVLGH